MLRLRRQRAKPISQRWRQLSALLWGLCAMKLSLLMPCSLAEVVNHHAAQAHAQLAASASQSMTDAERATVGQILAESERDLALYGHLIPGGKMRRAA
jgi:hypothetical protein